MENVTTYGASPNGSHNTTTADEHGSLPPHSREAEEALISSILIDPDCLAMLDIQPDMFFIGFNRELFKVFLSLRQTKQVIDFITVSDALRAKEIEKDDVLVGLLNVAPTSVHVQEYARIVRKYWNRRRLLSLAGTVATGAYDLDVDVEELVSETLDTIRVVGGDLNDDGPISSKDAAMNTLNEIEERRENPEHLEDALLTTGFLDIDRLLGGIERGSLVISAARPGVGKSLFEQHVRTHTAKEGKNVAVFNLEMTTDQLIKRQISSRLQIDYTKLKNPKLLNDNELNAVNKALGEISEYPIWYSDKSHFTIDQCEAEVHRLASTFGQIDLVTIDYLQLMSGGKFTRNRDEEIGQITRGMRRIAKDLNCVVWGNAQINRNVEHRQNKRPQLADLRESGNIEQDAHIVMFLYHDAQYNEESERANILEVEVSKHRNGPTGVADLYFNPQRMRIMNLQREAVSF